MTSSRLAVSGERCSGQGNKVPEHCSCRLKFQRRCYPGLVIRQRRLQCITYSFGDPVLVLVEHTIMNCGFSFGPPLEAL